MTDKIKSDGGSSEYYEIHIPQYAQDGTLKVRETIVNGEIVYVFQVEDVIEYGMSSDFDRGNLFKCNYRIGKKSGNTEDYELNKMQYSLDRLRQRFGNSSVESSEEDALEYGDEYNVEFQDITNDPWISDADWDAKFTESFIEDFERRLKEMHENRTNAWSVDGELSLEDIEPITYHRRDRNMRRRGE